MKMRLFRLVTAAQRIAALAQQRLQAIDAARLGRPAQESNFQRANQFGERAAVAAETQQRVLEEL